MFKINKESFFFFALILVAVTLSFSNLLINTLSIWLMIASWIIVSPLKEKIQLLKANKLIWLFSSIFIMYAIGLTYGNINIGLFEMEKKLSLLIFPIVLGTAPKINSKQLKIILVSFAVSCIVISLVCLIDTFYRNYSQGIVFFSDHFYSETSYGIINTHNDSWLFLNENLTKNYGFHPSYFSIYVAFSIFILLYILLRSENIGKFTRISLVIGVIYLVIFNFFLASRIGILSLSFLFICGMLLYSYKKRKLLAGLFVVLIFIFTILITIQSIIPIKEKFKNLIGSSGTEYSQYSAGSGRFELWQSSLLVIKDNLPFGIGTGDLQPALQKIYESKKFIIPYRFQYNPHNQFLEIAAVIGIIGLLIFFLCVFYPIYISFKTKNYLYLIFIFLFIFISLVECPFSVQKGVVWYGFFNSLFAFHSLKKLENEKEINIGRL